MARLLSSLLFALTAALVLHFGGVAAALYAGLYLLALTPGLPLGWHIFGRHTPLGWVAGAVIGYTLTALVFWVPAWLGAAHPLAFLAGWLMLSAMTWRWASGGTPLVSLPAWSARDSVRWLSLQLLVLLFVAIPFSRVGERDADGSRLYRAYFTADFVWHMAMTEELRRFEFPPTNPYLAPEPIHYYWTYFMVPAVLAGPEPAPMVPVETALKITAVGTALLMFSLVFLGAWSVTGSSGAAGAASAIALMAPSWEGAYALWGLWQNGASPGAMFEAVRGLNIDAVTNWQFGGLRIDGLVRSMWWTPQHAASFTLGLLALVVSARSPGRPARAVTAAIGLVLALSVVTNPLLGAAFCAAYGLVVLPRALRGAGVLSLRAQVLAIGPVGLALAWTILNQMGGGAGAAVSIGWQGLARHAPVTTLVLSLGGLLVPAALCVWPWRTRHLTQAWVAIPAVGIGLSLGWFVSITDIAWVGFRAGNILQVTLPLLAAAGLAALASRSRRAAVGLTVGLLILGAPTTLIDTFNAQDIENRTMGPGFRWVIALSPAQQAGFRWLRQATAPDAIVQTDPVPRGRENWSLIPSFGGRRMAAGDPISLLSTPEYGARGATVHTLLTTTDLAAAHASAQGLGIEFLWLDQDDDPQAAGRLRTRPDLFGLVFQRGDVNVFDIRPGPGSQSRLP